MKRECKNCKKEVMKIIGNKINSLEVSLKGTRIHIENVPQRRRQQAQVKIKTRIDELKTIGKKIYQYLK